MNQVKNKIKDSTTNNKIKLVNWRISLRKHILKKTSERKQYKGFLELF